MKILFILLIVISQPKGNWYEAPDYKHMIWEGNIGKIDEEIKDEWSTNIQEGDSIYPAKAHYKAVLFCSKEALDRYLTKNKIDQSSVLIDIKLGKTIKVTQTPIIEKVEKTEEVLKGYNFSIEAEIKE